jgi:hypothetical protein
MRLSVVDFQLGTIDIVARSESATFISPFYKLKGELVDLQSGSRLLF